MTFKNLPYIKTKDLQDLQLVDNSLKVGDTILIVWDDDNKKPTRVLSKVKKILNNKIHYGGHYTDEAEKWNAATCTSGITNIETDLNSNYPQYIFLIKNS